MPSISRKKLSKISASDSIAFDTAARAPEEPGTAYHLHFQSVEHHEIMNDDENWEGLNSSGADLSDDWEKASAQKLDQDLAVGQKLYRQEEQIEEATTGYRPDNTKPLITASYSDGVIQIQTIEGVALYDCEPIKSDGSKREKFYDEALEESEHDALTSEEISEVLAQEGMNIAGFSDDSKISEESLFEDLESAGFLSSEHNSADLIRQGGNTPNYGQNLHPRKLTSELTTFTPPDQAKSVATYGDDGISLEM